MSVSFPRVLTSPCRRSHGVASEHTSRLYCGSLGGGFCAAGCMAAQGRPGKLTRSLRLGRPLWAGLSPPCQSTRRANSPLEHSAPSQFSICFAHCILSTAPLQSLLCFFPFLFYPSTTRAPRAPLLFFSLRPVLLAISKKASFCCPLRPLRRTWRHCFRQSSSAVETRPPLAFLFSP